MEALLVLLALYLLVVLLVLPIWMLIKIGEHRRNQEAMEHQLGHLEDEVKQLRTALLNRPAAPAPKPVTPPLAPVGASLLATPPPPVVIAPVPPVVPPPAPLAPNITPPPLAAVEPPEIPVAPPPLIPEPVHTPPARVVYTPPPPAPGWMDSINWEQFMGAKLFAWLGGLALFLGVAFFVKYSFEHNIIPKEVRVAIGFVLGAGFIVGGLKISREKYAPLAQTLIAAGIVSLYAVTFACRSIYHFEFFGLVPTFLLMTLITATAFILAVRLEAQVVAILGILGGFLTPILINTGQDNPVGLFGYLAVLNLGLVAVALHRLWFHLVPLGAAGTVILMLGWADKFYAPEKTVTAMTVCLGFSALFIGTTEVARRLKRVSPLLSQTAIVLPAVAFCFAWYFLGYPAVAGRTGLFFGFVFLASLGYLFLAWREELGGLVTGAAGVTALLMVRWAAQTFKPEQAPVVMTVCLVFSGIYFGVYLLARRWERATAPVLWSAAGLPAVALAFALFFMSYSAVGARPGLLFAFILASDGLLLALAWLDERVPKLHLLAGLTVFALLSIWTAEHLTDALLPWALAMYLVFAALHAVFPLVLERRHPAAAPTWWSQLFPPLTLLLMLLPIFKLATVSFLLWPAILLVDLIAIGLAVLSASLAAVAAVLVLTLVATGLCIFRLPVAFGIDASLLAILGGFAVFFFAASLWLVRRLGDRLPAADRQLSAVFGDSRAQLPAFASLLPFLLLIMACARLTVPDPAAVFGLGLLLVVLTLGLALIIIRKPFDGLRASDSETHRPAMSDGRPAGVEWLPACALAGMAGLELVWHSRHFDPAAAGGPLAWYAGFYALFAVYPFLFRRDFARLTGPWAVAALSGLAHFWLVYQAIKISWPGDFLGAIPALFALAPLGSLVVILRTAAADNPKRLNQLAWFGGVALFFITLIFPIQFERQWLTVAWALEGAALLWLFHRVPHPGLRATGTVLLVTAFVRLALNPAVLGYHVRGDTAILNWYLYAYGLATAALFAGARLVAPPRERVLGINTPPLLNTLGVILAFILLNIEIADYFTAPGARALAFQFSGHFARDMSYTIGWALFALGLLAAGIWRQTRAARYAAIALLSVALLKLFFHNLARLKALYRVGALFAVAVIAMLASFAYQRFLPGNEKSPPLLPRRLALPFAFFAVTCGAALTPTEWQHRQALNVAAPGLTKIALPAATFDSAQRELSDLRVIDATGTEVPYLLDCDQSVRGFERAPAFNSRSFHSSPDGDIAQLVFETGSTVLLDAIDLETPVPYFLKAAHVEISADGAAWQSLGAAVPVFRQFGAEQLRLSLNRQKAAFIRVTLDEFRSRKIAFTGAKLLPSPTRAEPPALAPLSARITRRDEFANETVLTVTLDGRHVPLAALSFDAKDPLFMRRVSVAIREVRGAGSSERTIGAGTIYRVALDGAPARTQLELPLEFTPPTRELLVHIHNGDSPPLTLDGVAAKQHPVNLLFLAPAAGSFTLLSGNPQAAAPRYDLAAFAGEMRGAGAATVIPGELEAMPDYHPRESLATAPLPDVPLTGAPLDAKDWPWRRPFRIERAGAQELELDPAALAGSRADFADLRLLRDGNQIPYVLEQPALARSLTLTPVPAPDPKRPTVSVWRVQLPHAGLPLRRLVLTSATPLFQRQFRLYEKTANPNGGTVESTLAEGSWSRTPEPGVPETRTFEIPSRLRTDTILIETDNGDNPAIALGAVQAVYPVVRLVFKVVETDGFALAYGHKSANAPRYDLSLVAVKLLTSSRNVAQLTGGEQAVRSGNFFAGLNSGYVFWGALTLVVVVLLVVVAKLLPKQPPA